MIRHDLLALDEAKLASLATKGHVKRAVKDLAAGRGPELSVDADGTVVAVLEVGEARVETRLPLDVPLRDAPCTCHALKVCRHRVMAVLAYRTSHRPDPEAAGEPASPWSPAVFGDASVAELLGRWTLARAKRKKKRGYVAEVVRGATPRVELASCTVRFLVREALNYARCECEVGVKCEHIALAVWAFREADEHRPEGSRVVVEVGAVIDLETGALDAANDLARELLLDGALGSGAALAVRFARAKQPLSEAQLQWPLDICADLEDALESYADRGATYHPERVATLLTELHARTRAARGGGELPARAVLGIDEPSETALEHVRLVSLGCRLTREPRPDGAYRVSAAVCLGDPDTQTVLVLDKSWDVGEDDVGATLARRHVIKNVSLGALARGQMVTKAAKRRANRTLVLGRGGVGRTSVTPQRGDWSLFRAPLRPDNFGALRRELAALPPAFVRPRLVAARMRVIAVSSVEEVSYHPGDQTLRGLINDADGSSLEVELTHSAAAPGALDALADALQGDVRYISGEVRREGDGLLISPLSIVTDRVIALDVEPTAKDERRFDAYVPSHRRPIQDALIAARDHLDRGAHTGLRHLAPPWRTRLEEHARQLQTVGLTECAERSRQLLTSAAATLGGEADTDEPLARSWLDLSLRIRLALEAGVSP